jgi:cation transport ATPase
MFVAGDGQPAGFVGVVDLIKTTTADAIRSLLPDQKAEVGNRVQQRGKRVAMAGDGINGRARARIADVGIAMGTGTDGATSERTCSSRSSTTCWACRSRPGCCIRSPASCSARSSRALR